MTPWYIPQDAGPNHNCLGEQLEVNGRVKGLFYSSLGPCYIELHPEEQQPFSTSFPSSMTTADAAFDTSSSQEALGDAITLAVEHPPEERETKLLTAATVVSNNITTVMMHGLPRPAGTPFVAAWLCEMIPQEHLDCIYTPYDMKTKTNQGFAFISLSSIEATAALVERATGLYLQGHVHFMAADIQGAEALVKKIMQRKLHRIRNPELRPYIARRLLAKAWMKQVNGSAHRKHLFACTSVEFPRL
eukprot:CAMPEP_0178450374 /NCGR_PEP_ID=MMETSP0689_2-20121128/43089_1 /TAXON_ID=160604 /ORGANISM="Amphidinium massartii, Strain CS-259" /LENGTH=245 /DNA_ID=CAMNT_0020075833 /DNA_START=26 /DNA_END=763 /DNA_ORIENTATION=-